MVKIAKKKESLKENVMEAVVAVTMVLIGAQLFTKYIVGQVPFFDILAGLSLLIFIPIGIVHIVYKLRDGRINLAVVIGYVSLVVWILLPMFISPLGRPDALFEVINTILGIVMMFVGGVASLQILDFMRAEEVEVLL